MAFDFELGSKNPKKTINVELKPKHLVLGFILLMLLSYFILLGLVNLGFGDKSVNCVNGSTEVVEFGKEYYCGEHYSTLRNRLSESTFNDIEVIIKNGNPE